MNTRLNTQPMQIGLAPCPFCKSATHLRPSGKLVKTAVNGYGLEVSWGRFYVRCTACNARGPVVSGWTMRPHPPLDRQAHINGKVRRVLAVSDYYKAAMQAWDKAGELGGEQE